MLCIMKSLKFGRLEAADLIVCSGKKKKEKKRKKNPKISLILQVWDWDSLMILDLACIRTLNLEIIINTKKSHNIYYIVSSISGVY